MAARAAMAPKPTSYLDAPGAALLKEREGLGACLVCGFQVKGCWCRFCTVCRRFWIADRPLARDPEADHHGIAVCLCPNCPAAAPAPWSSS